MMDRRTFIAATAAAVVTAPMARATQGQSSFAKRQIENWRKNIAQMTGFTTVPLADVPGARARYPDNRPKGIAIQGPVYSSTRTIGRALGQDITIRTYISMMRNPHSAQYSRDLYAETPYGRAFAGAVCSNIFRNSFGWAYTPTTTMMTANPAAWGFSHVDPRFRARDVRVGDCFVTWPTGGHIEGCFAKTATTITLFDQTYDGPSFITYSHAEFMAYAKRRRYALLRFDYENSVISYTPNPYSPLRGETPGRIAHDDVVTTAYGFGFNYAQGDAIRININSKDVTRFTIRHAGTVIETGTTTGGETLSRRYAQTGDYQVSCTMTDGRESVASEFQICRMEGALSANTVQANAPVTFVLDTYNCNAHTLLLVDQTHRSISHGFIQKITDAERAAGQVVFSHHRPGSWFVRPRAEHRGGAAFPAKTTAYPLTIV